MRTIFIFIFSMTIISCAIFKKKEVFGPANLLVYEWEKAILNKAIQVNNNNDCSADIEYYKRYTKKPNEDGYFLVGLFNFLLQTGNLKSLEDDFDIIHEETIHDHNIFLLITENNQIKVDKFSIIKGEWVHVGSNTLDSSDPIFSTDDLYYVPECPGKLFQSTIFTTFKKKQITVTRLFPQVCEPLDTKLSSLVKENR